MDLVIFLLAVWFTVWGVASFAGYGSRGLSIFLGAVAVLAGLVMLYTLFVAHGPFVIGRA
jgi:hypothetical protein